MFATLQRSTKRQRQQQMQTEFVNCSTSAVKARSKTLHLVSKIIVNAKRLLATLGLLEQSQQHVARVMLLDTLARLLGPVQAGVCARVNRAALVLLQHAVLATLTAILVAAHGAHPMVRGATARWPAAVTTNTLSISNAQRAFLELQEMQATKLPMKTLNAM